MPPSHPARAPRESRESFEDALRGLEEGRLGPARALALLREEPPAAGNGREARVAAVLQELDGLVGLRQVKELVRELHAFVEVRRRRAEAGLATDPLALHMVFRGNPGTGKTTIARLLGRLFREMDVLAKGHLVEVERADLVGEYIGHTAQKTREQIRRALDGILFIDEAYSLARGGEKDFGKEAIDTLVRAMENHRDNLILILAGYNDEMEYFLRTNPGLRSRFPIQIDFPDYSVGELMRIADLMLQKRQYRFAEDARAKLEEILRAPENQRLLSTGNARLTRNIIERAIRRQALRLVQQPTTTVEDLMTIRAVDLIGVLP
ncbi:MAG: AAA family ATPase [Firmicutes bacterium]|nr:AAA family ATPase [Bacillota bacterium]